MPDEKKSWMRRRVEGAIRSGLTRTYDTIKVDPRRFLMQLRVAHGLPVATFQGVYTLPVERLDDVAEAVIRGGMKMAAAEGAGFGLGGILTIVPDLGCALNYYFVRAWGARARAHFRAKHLEARSRFMREQMQLQGSASRVLPS